MAFALIGSGVAAVGANADSVTTGTYDTTGADLLVLALTTYAPSGAATPTDSKTNTWVGLTAVSSASADTPKVQLWYAVAPIVGSGHTFSYADTQGYPALSVLAFSGAHLTTPFQAENGATAASGTSLSAGSVSPSATDLFVAAFGWNNETYANVSIGSSFTKQAGVGSSAGVAFGGAIAWKISSSAEDPAWARPNSNAIGAVIAVFKAPVGGGSTIVRQMIQHHHYRPRQKTREGLVLPTHRDILTSRKAA